MPSFDYEIDFSASSVLYEMSAIPRVIVHVLERGHTWWRVLFNFMFFRYVFMRCVFVCACACPEWELIESGGELDNGRFLAIFKPHIIYQLNEIAFMFSFTPLLEHGNRPAAAENGGIFHAIARAHSHRMNVETTIRAKAHFAPNKLLLPLRRLCCTTILIYTLHT